MSAALVVINCKTGHLTRFLGRQKTHQCYFGEGNARMLPNGGDWLTCLETLRVNPKALFPGETA